MVKNLISKAELSRLAGVTAGAVTKAIKKDLHVAMTGKRIDANHPKVVEYIAGHDGVPTESPAPGIDPLYEDVVEWCRLTNRPSISGIQREFKIGYNRAAKIKTVIDATEADKQPATPKATAATSTTKKKEALAKLNDVDTGTVLHKVPDDIKKFADMTLRELIQRFGTDTAFLDWLKATKSIEDINEKRLKNAATRGELVSRHLVKVGVLDHIESAHTKLLTDGKKTIARRVHAMANAGRSVEECESFIDDQISSFLKPMKAKMSRALKNA